MTSRTATVAAALLVLLASCHQPLRTAPYRVRPDSTDAGSLLGPFTGRVVDASSGEPVSGALVYATWSVVGGYGFHEPAGVREVVRSTDSDGRYVIPRLEQTPEKGRLADFNLVVYKRGYVAYRSDRRFFDFGPRRDFAQLRNEVSLERWSADYSHVRHVRYVGGGSAMSALTAWQAAEATAELTRTKTGSMTRIASDISPRRPRDVIAAQLLTAAEIIEITSYDGEFETGPLGDEPDTAAYSSQHFKALGRPQTFDVAVRLWKLDQGAAERRYEDLAELLPSMERTNEIGDASFRAVEDEIYAVGYLDRGRGVVVMLTCGSGQCNGETDALDMARKSYENLEARQPAVSEDGS